MENKRMDCRAEWYRDFDPLAASKPHIPRIYWLGMLASAIWLVAYLLIYPSIPLPGGHSRGIGEPGGCQPWTAICEQEIKQRTIPNDAPPSSAAPPS